VRAYITTCEARAAVCADTVAALAATDWGEPPVLVIDESTHQRALARILETGRRLLTRAVDEADDLVLYLEDDLAFNRWLRHNLEHWVPLADRRPGDPFFGSLYNPNIVPPTAPTDRDAATVVDPRRFYGSQAMLLSVTTARTILDQWDDATGPLDLRVSRLAARRSPIWFHRPSLVQHLPVTSASGGATHEAIDFSPDWRALTGTDGVR
jgi:hypothetical protein